MRCRLFVYLLVERDEALSAALGARGAGASVDKGGQLFQKALSILYVGSVI